MASRPRARGRRSCAPDPRRRGQRAECPAPSAPIDLDTAGVARALGAAGKVNGGVYQVSVPRAERVTDHDMEVPPSIGVATAINFQPTGGGKPRLFFKHFWAFDARTPLAASTRSRTVPSSFSNSRFRDLSRWWMDNGCWNIPPRWPLICGMLPFTHAARLPFAPLPMISRNTLRRRAGLTILGAAFVSFLLSITLWFTGSHEQGLFVGLWVPSILSFGSVALLIHGDSVE